MSGKTVQDELNLQNYIWRVWEDRFLFCFLLNESIFCNFLLIVLYGRLEILIDDIQENKGFWFE